MIERNTNIVNRFIVVLSVIVFLDVMNIIMNLYTNVNDNIGLNIVDMVFIVKFIALVSLLITLVRWSSNRDANLLKQQVIIHTVYALGLMMFYFFILYLFKYSILLNAMDILRNKMIGGNAALLLNFAIYTYNTLKFVRGAYSGFSSEFVLMLEIVFVVWHFRNILTLNTKSEEPKEFDNFLYTNNKRLVAIALVVMSFLSINLFQYTFEYIDAIMFLVSAFLFSIQIPLTYTIMKIGSTNRSVTYPSQFKAMYDIVYILSLVSMIGYVVYIVVQGYAMTQGIFSYRLYSSVIALGLSIFMFFFTQRNRSLIV